MGQKFYTLLTQQGAALLANATALGIPLKLSKMAVGDANGNPTTPDASQTKLVHEVYQAPLNSLNTDEKNPNQIIAELVIPENQGGWFINEIGLYDKDDNLVAVGNCPATYKPKLSEGSGRTQVIRMIIVVDNVNAVALKIDPSVVLAPRQYVNDLITSKIVNHEKSTNHPDATTKSKGFVQLNSATDSTIENQAATPKAVRDAYEYARFSDIKAQSAYDHASAAHNRIDPIADKFQSHEFESRIFSQDKRFYQIVRDDGVVGLYSLVKNDFSWFINHDGWISGFIEAPRVGGLDQFVRDRTTPVGVPMPWPQVQPPTGYFECNGAKFDKNQFTKLAAAYPSGKLPDLRGEFIRGWDNAKGTDPNREILDWQQDAIRDIWGRLSVVARSAGQGPIEAEGAFNSDSRWNAAVKGGNSDDWGRVYSFNASRVVPVAHENRPRNIAFMYIVKAE